MTTLNLAAHLSTADLGRGYRAARDPLARSHLQIIGLFRQGRDEREGAAVTGYRSRWLAEIVRRSNEDGLGDRRARKGGAKPRLGEDEEAARRDAWSKPPAEGGLWTGRKVAAWRGARLGRKVGPQRGWDYLRRLGPSLQVPRPRPAEAASAAEQGLHEKARRAGGRASKGEAGPQGRSRGVRCWTAALSSGSGSSRSCGGPGEPWARVPAGPDRARRDRGAPQGQRPIAVGRHRFEWLHLDGFVHPVTGEVVWFGGNTVATDLFAAVLAAFAQAVGAGEDKLVLLVLDKAGWHKSDKLVVPDGIELAFLPPYTPELQPAARLWPLPNEAVANENFATLEDLDAVLGERCRTLAAMPETIKRLTGFDWWPAASTTAAPLN